MNHIVRLPHPRNRVSQPGPGKITIWNHHPFISTLRSKGLSCSKMKW